MLDWLNEIKKKAEDSSVAIPASLTLRVIGDRASGKTTYMASLARWPNADPSSPVQAVEPFNEDGKKLVTQAQNILEQGLRLEPTRLDEHADATDLPDYGFTIVLKGQFSLRNPKLNAASQVVTLNINCKDYSGEFFTDLIYRTGDALLQDYLNDCLQADGILFLVDGIAYSKDAEYARGLDKFLTSADQFDRGAKKRRIALVLSKCEQPDLWVNRHKPRELAIARFPEVYRKLESWQQLGKGSVEYFASSAFGTLGTRYPEPNSRQIRRDRDGVASVIKEPKHWRPFGLVAPIYWLYMGERHKGLDKD
jgi:GTPase SAR1 family protein